MNQILTLWNALEPRKRVMAILSAVVMFAAVLGLARAVNEPNFSLLYAGLDPSTSGEIVTALDQQQIAFEVRGNAIYVDSAVRDQARMSLAAKGLPANGIAGYELLDGLSGFSTTSQMFDAAYWRAKEGELARTILASPQVRSARVHIANPVSRPFDRTSQPSASVIVGLGGGTLSAAQAKAMRYLVSSAVTGLQPENVSVIDSINGVFLAAGAEPEATPGEDVSERAAKMRTNVERILAARVGPGNAIVELNIDADMDSETISERVLDPDGRVAISSDNEENSSTASGTGSSGVTVASNLPDGDVQGGGGNSQSANNKTRQRVNYEVSEIRRERVKHPGQIRRISVAVLVNDAVTVDESGTATVTPRSDEEISALQELVKSAIGFDETRGDVVTIQSMEFTGPTGEGTFAEAGAMDFLSANAMKLLQMAVFAIVALALGMGVLKPILTTPPPLPAPGGPDNGTVGPDGIIAAGDPGSVNPNGEIELNPEVLAPEEPRNENVERLKQAISDRTEDSKEILQSWLDTPEPNQQQV